jgi:hypothetical protein
MPDTSSDPYQVEAALVSVVEPTAAVTVKSWRICRASSRHFASVSIPEIVRGLELKSRTDAHAVMSQPSTVVCTENLSWGVVVVKPAKDGLWFDASDSLKTSPSYFGVLE